jgi:hypothetical protein
MRSSSIYEAYGRFAVQFEKTCGALEVLIDKILFIEGLQKKETRDIILAGLTAEPLRDLAQSLVGKYLEPSKKDEKIISSVFNQFKDLTSKRNEILHARLNAWSIEHGEEYTEYITGYKLHRNKAGEANKNLEHTYESLTQLQAEAKKIFFSICQLRKCIEESLELEKQFVKNENGKYQKISSA